MSLPTFEEAARAANSVVNDPAVIARIRQAAGIPDPDLIVIDTDWYTIDEIDLIEEMTGQAFTKFMQGDGPKAKELRILALLIRRRTDPEFPAERAGSLKVTFNKAPIPPTNGSGLEHSSPLPDITE